MVEPQPDVVWMVDAFTRTRLERVAACDEVPFAVRIGNSVGFFNDVG